MIATTVMMIYARVPDQDQYIPESIISHRGPTHSVLFAFILAFISASTVTYPFHFGQQLAVEHNLISTAVIVPSTVWAFFAGVVVISILTHIITDALTKGGGFKVKPLWPFSLWSPALGLCTADDKRWNTALLASGATAFMTTILHEVYYSVLPTVTVF
jgi:Predicted membrane-bound metal-dependent hydrolase (DUF457).